MNNIVCIDTQILIWGLKEQATTGQTEMIQRAKNFLQHLDSDGKNILIPSLVIGELLVPIPAETHQMVINLIEAHYIVAPFDTKSAAIFARIFREKKADETLKELQANGSTRTKLKTDCLIIATAIAHNAACIYSHDGKDMARFADGHIPILQMPKILNQLKIPGTQ